MEYSRDCLENPQSMALTKAHVIAHLSSICSIDDNEDRFAHEVVVRVSSLPDDRVRINGRIDREPVAPYLTPQLYPRTLAIPGATLAKRLQEKLTAMGVKWRVLDGADRRGNGQVWGDVAGGIMHHTASKIGPAPPILWQGRPDLSPPLANTAGEGDGTIAFIAYHPANHAGASGGKGTAPLPVTKTFNKRVWGHEIVYPGTSPMTVAQYTSAIALGRALREVLGVPASHIRAHAETSVTGKWDPGQGNGKTIDMAAFRRLVAEEDDMGLTPEQDAMLRRVHHELTLFLPNRRGDGWLGKDTTLGYAANADAFGARNESFLRTVIYPLLQKLASADMIDENAVAAAVVAQIRPLIEGSVRAAMGEDNQGQAEAILEELGNRMKGTS